MKFRASEMPRVAKCHGSKSLQLKHPSTDGSESREGTVAHAVAAGIIGGREPESYLGQSIDNIYIDQEMLSHIAVYTSECGSKSGSVEVGRSLEACGNTLTGTPDFDDFDFDTGTLIVKDLKYGHGWVEARMNFQLLCYAILCFKDHEAKMPNFGSLCKRVALTIIQPRASHPEGPVRKWEFDAVMLRNYGNQIFDAMQEAARLEPSTATGVHCRYCRALVHCHTASEVASHTVEMSGNARSTEMTPEILACEREIVGRGVKMLEHRLTALEEYGIGLSKTGKLIPGWEARATVGNLEWSVDAVTIGDAMKVDLRAPEKPITPTQAIGRKLLTADTVASLAARKPGGVKFKRIDNARAKRILSNG